MDLIFIINENESKNAKGNGSVNKNGNYVQLEQEQDGKEKTGLKTGNNIRGKNE